MTKKTIVMIGSGNVATHMAQTLFNAGHKILQVYSRNLKNARTLSQLVNAEPISNIKSITPEAHLHLISISDKAIEPLVSAIEFEPMLIAHTAGSISMDALSRFRNYGVFYPLQTFSKQRKVDFSQLPMCLEANSQKNLDILTASAKSITQNVNYLNSEQRKQAHLSAVFACNFVNHFYAVAQHLLKEKNIDFDLIKPLILETAQKVQDMPPLDAQTGPAMRGDTGVINDHLKQLTSDRLEKLYSFVSDSINEMHQKR